MQPQSDYWRLAKMAFIYGACAAGGSLLASVAAKLISKGADYFAARRAAEVADEQEEELETGPAPIADED